MTETEIYAGLNEIFRDLFADDSIVLTPETTADQVPGWDSFNHINILVAAEGRFGVRMNSAETEGLVNVGALVGYIRSRLG